MRYFLSYEKDGVAGEASFSSFRAYLEYRRGLESKASRQLSWELSGAAKDSGVFFDYCCS